MVTDSHMHAGNEFYRIWWDEKLRIAHGQAVGALEVEAAEGILRETQKMADEHGQEIDWLIDLSQMTSATSPARKILAIASSHPSIRKYAFFGASTFIRTVANFLIASAGQKNACHFANASEALQWLREER